MPARLIIEQNEAGEYYIEYYINGSRQRKTINLFDAQFEISSAMREIKLCQKAQADRKKRLQEDEEISRHRRVWNTAASRPNQGPKFANEKIGPKTHPIVTERRIQQINNQLKQVVNKSVEELSKATKLKVISFADLKK